MTTDEYRAALKTGLAKRDAAQAELEKLIEQLPNGHQILIAAFRLVRADAEFGQVVQQPFRDLEHSR